MVERKPKKHFFALSNSVAPDLRYVGRFRTRKAAARKLEEVTPHTPPYLLVGEEEARKWLNILSVIEATPKPGRPRKIDPPPPISIAEIFKERSASEYENLTRDLYRAYPRGAATKFREEVTVRYFQTLAYSLAEAKEDAKRHFPDGTEFRVMKITPKTLKEYATELGTVEAHSLKEAKLLARWVFWY